MEIVSEESVSLVANELSIDAESVLTTVASEVEFRLRQVVQDSAKFMNRSRRQRLMTKDVERALKVRGWPQMHGYHSNPEKFKYWQDQNIFFLEEETVDLNRILEDSDKLFLPRKVPLKPSYGIHWLAVDGVQPSIADNPLIHRSEETRKEEALTGNKEASDMVKHVLSKELQIYYDKVVNAVVDAALGNTAMAESVFTSLSVDPGLQKLMPYLSKFIFDQVNKSLRNLSLLYPVMRLTRCILINPNLNKELYLHYLMPPILTCIVHRKLCSSPFMDHWSLREFSSKLIPIIYTQYGDLYQDIKPRITKTLHDALVSKDKPMTTQYGAIVGLSAMGPLTIQSVLLPVMRKLLNRYNKVMVDATTIPMRLEAQHCIGALQAAFGMYLQACSSPTLAKSILLEEHIKPARAVFVTAGEACIPWAVSSEPLAHEHMQLFL